MDLDVADSHDLFDETDQVHLDAGENRIVESVVPKLVQCEVRSELTIEAHQDVQVEGRGDTQRVVVGAVQHQRVLLQIHTDQQSAVVAAHFGDLGEEEPRILQNED